MTSHPNPSERYRSLVRARSEQQSRLGAPYDESYWDRFAHTYRFDPTRTPEPQLAATLEHLSPDDEIIEVGGGAGRIGLPMALRARSLTNVEPSDAMRDQFAISVNEHGITNATSIASTWPLNEPISADIVLTVDVTYFIDDIEPFIRAMHDAARWQVMILTWTVPPPNVSSALFEVAYGEPQAPSPGFRELLPVIWELGVVPDVRVFEQRFEWPERLPANDDEAVAFALDDLGMHSDPQVSARIREALPQLFERGDRYRPLWRTPSKAMLITWPTEA